MPRNLLLLLLGISVVASTAGTFIKTEFKQAAEEPQGWKSQ